MEALIKYCFERDRLQAVCKVEQMNPALAAEALGVDFIRVSLSLGLGRRYTNIPNPD